MAIYRGTLEGRREEEREREEINDITGVQEKGYEG